MSENDMAKIARPVADPHADKDAEIYDAEHVAAIAEFNEKAALARVAELEAAWTDDKGTTWRPPTAWAYAQSCRVREELRARVAKLEAALREIGREQSAKTATVAADKFQSIARAALSETVEA